MPTDPHNAPYFQSIRLPEAMGNGLLTARLKPDRILAQSVDLSAEDVKAIRQAATNVAILREAPEVGSRASGELTNNQPYRIVGSRGKWVRLSAGNGVLGWTSVDAFCQSECRKALDTGIFANDVLAIAAGKFRGSLPQTISKEAGAFSDQVASLKVFKRDPRRATELVGRWLGKALSPDDIPAESAKVPVPGEAGFANLFAVARIENDLQTAREQQSNFDHIRLEASFIRGIANDLATASVSDPADLTILDNLAVLYGYLGDNRRRDLALKIADSIGSR